MMHQKHPKLDRPHLEGLARMEVALVGTPCGRIETQIEQLSHHLNHHWRVINVDADHHTIVEGIERRQAERIVRCEPFSNEQWFDDKLVGQYFDLALINGNHYPAKHQLVFLDTEKEGSLKRRKDQLTDVLAYIKVDSKGFDWLEMHSETPVFTTDDTEALADLLHQKLNSGVPDMSALILAGGESRRMGRDKSQIRYHGETQEIHLARLCRELKLPVSISKRHSDETTISGFPVLIDTFTGLGPYGAILSALRENRNQAVLVLACDLPYVDSDAIEKLIRHRSTRHFMTALKARSKDFAEPLAAIYEPRMYGRMLAALSVGYNCPTKVLRNTDILEVAVDDKIVHNVNTEEERREVRVDR